MAPLSRQRQLELEAEAEAEAQFEFEQEQAQVRSDALGPDYNKSYLGVAAEGPAESLSGLAEFGKSAWDFAMPIDSLTFSGTGGWYDTTKKAGLEKSLNTIGNLASGTAGYLATAPAGTLVGGGIGTLAAPILGPWTIPAGAALGNMIAGGAGAGAASSMYNAMGDWGNTPEELRPSSEYVKDFIYNTTQGATLGPLTELPFRGLGVAARSAKNPFNQAAAERRAVNFAQTLDPTLTAQTLDEALAARADDPFLQYQSLGEVLDSPVFKSAERGVERSGIQNFGRKAEINRARVDAELRYLDNLEPDKTLTPDDIQSLVRENVAQDIKAAEVPVERAKLGVESALGQLEPGMDVEAAGQLARESVAEGAMTSRQNVSKKFSAIGEGAVDPTQIRSRVDALKPNYFREVGATPDPALITLLDKIDKATEAQPSTSGLLDASGQPITTERTFNMKDLQALSSDAISIVKNSDSRSKALASEALSAIDDAVKQAVEAGNITPEQYASWLEGKRARAIHGDIFESKTLPAKKLLQKEYSGSYSVQDTNVPGRIFFPENIPGKRGAREAMRNYRQAGGDMDPINQYATDSFRQKVVNADGTVDIKKTREWLRQHEEALKENPELRNQLNTVEKAQSFLNEKYGDLKRTQAEVEEGALKLWLRDVEPMKAAREMLSGKDSLRRTKATYQYLKSKDPAAVTGLRRVVLRLIKDEAFIPSTMQGVDEALLSGQQFAGSQLTGTFAKRLSDMKPLLERSGLFTKDQLKGFDYLYNNQRSKLSVENAKPRGDSSTAANLSVLAEIGNIYGQKFVNMAAGVSGGRVLQLIAGAVRQIPRNKYLMTLEEFLLNPRYARDLLQKANTKRVTRTLQEMFKDDIAKSMSAMGGVKALPSVAVNTIPDKKPKKPYIPNQQAVTSKKSFPDPKELLSPPAKGSLGGISVKEYLEGLDQETQSRISVESSGDPFAVSPKGAQGLSQLMPKTAQQVARELGEIYTPLREGMTPEEQKASIDQNIRFGKYYYNQQLKKYGNSTLAWAAYNAGPGATDDAIKMAGTSRDVGKVLSYLPEETRNYVKTLKRLNGMG